MRRETPDYQPGPILSRPRQRNPLLSPQGKTIYDSAVSSLPDQVAQNIDSRHLFKAGQGILVAVSGGLDSVVLLHLLHSMAANAKWKLAVAHLNHRLRGRAADLDAAWVSRAAGRLGLPLAAGKADVRALAKKHKLSLEMAARNARHDFLARAARRFGFSTIALAHHADDQIELFFMRLLRGSGGEGLAGMKWRNLSPADPKLKLVRPLLNVSKQVLGVYAKSSGLAFREDATNRSLDILRNRIRHELLPLLRRRYQSGLDKTVLRVMEIVGADSDLALTSAQAWLRTKPGLAKCTAFEQLPIAVQRRAIQIQLVDLGSQPDFDLVENLRLKSDCPVSMSAGKEAAALSGLQVARTLDGQVRLQVSSTPAFNKRLLHTTLKGNSGTIAFEALRVDWRQMKRAGASRAMGRPGREWFDADAVGRRITLRHWSKGDRFQPIGMSRAAKLQDIFTNLKIPRGQRHQLVVAEAENGLIFWVERLRISERFKLNSGTKRRLEWRWKRAGMRVAV